MNRATQRYRSAPMRLPRSGDTAFGKVGTFWGSKNLQFSEGGFANLPQNGDTATPRAHFVPLVFVSFLVTYATHPEQFSGTAGNSHDRQPPMSQFRWNECFPQPVHGAAQATALASALDPRKTELAEAVCPGAARGRPAGPRLLPLRSLCAVAAKPPDMRVDGPLTSEARHPIVGAASLVVVRVRVRAG
jgi:hypothetical protein